uniref:NPH3 domain-containing protein n=1 Tax=Oryza punctata TaxID=4537 RepID=A0A0E0KZ54_ORYPU
MKPPSPPHGSSTASPRATAAAVKQPASSPDARLTPSSPVVAASLVTVMPPRRSCDDAASCVVNDVDAFARTIASIRSKPAAPSAAAASSSSDGGGGDHLATVLAHYAARWLPDVASSPSGRFLLPPQSPTATWIRKRLLLESLVAALPPDGGDGDDGGVTCDFLLRLLRAGSMAGADAALLADLEARAARRLDQASLGAVMIPAFRVAGDTPGASATLLDVPLVLRLVRGFLREGGKPGGGGAAAACRVARLVDAYLAEAALEVGLRPAEFEELARAVPAHARAADDGLYRAVDTYLKAHPQSGKEERRSLCRLIDARKLTAEAAAHAVQNERLPVRCVVQVLFSEHGSKLTRLAEWTTGSFRSLQSRSPADLITTTTAAAAAANGGARCPSKREVAAQHHELRRLREDVSRLQVQCHALQAQVDRLSSERRRRPGLFKWGALLFGGGGGGATGAAGGVVVDDSDSGLDRTPLSGKKGVVRATTAAAGTTPASGTPAVARWRRSHS